MSFEKENTRFWSRLRSKSCNLYTFITYHLERHCAKMKEITIS